MPPGYALCIFDISYLFVCIKLRTYVVLNIEQLALRVIVIKAYNNVFACSMTLYFGGLLNTLDPCICISSIIQCMNNSKTNVNVGVNAK